MSGKFDKKIPLLSLHRHTAADAATGFIPIHHPEAAPDTPYQKLPIRDIPTIHGTVHSVDFRDFPVNEIRTLDSLVSPNLTLHWFFRRDTDDGIIWHWNGKGEDKILSNSVYDASHAVSRDQPPHLQLLLNGVPPQNFVYAYHYKMAASSKPDKYLTLMFVNNPKSLTDDNSHHRLVEFRWIVTDKPLK